MTRIEKIDAVIAPGKFPPRWGWHDDHRQADGTPNYLPALQQVRSEYEMFLDVLAGCQLPNGSGSMFEGRFLQLGLGECQASHAAWMTLFKGGGVTLDKGTFLVDWVASFQGGNTHDPSSRDFAAQKGPYDFLFVDAGHDYEDVRLDHFNYGPMVRRGGIIAFHDSLARAAYPEVEVHHYLAKFCADAKQIGSEVGIAWIVKA